MKPHGSVIVGFFLLVLSCCSGDLIESRIAASPDGSAQIDLQGGFAGNSVRLELNGVSVLDSSFSNLVPFAGPLMSVEAGTKRGSNTLAIQWSCNDVDANCITFRKSETFIANGQQTIYIYLNIHDGVADFKAQNEPFFYL